MKISITPAEIIKLLGLSDQGFDVEINQDQSNLLAELVVALRYLVPIDLQSTPSCHVKIQRIKNLREFSQQWNKKHSICDYGYGLADSKYLIEHYHEFEDFVIKHNRLPVIEGTYPTIVLR